MTSSTRNQGYDFVINIALPLRSSLPQQYLRIIQLICFSVLHCLLAARICSQLQEVGVVASVYFLCFHLHFGLHLFASISTFPLALLTFNFPDPSTSPSNFSFLQSGQQLWKHTLSILSYLICYPFSFHFMAGAAIFVIVTWCVMAGTGAIVAIFACFEKKTVWRSRRNRSRERASNSHLGDPIRSTSEGSLGFPTIHPIRILGSFSFLESSRISQYEPDSLGWQQYHPRERSRLCSSVGLGLL